MVVFPSTQSILSLTRLLFQKTVQLSEAVFLFNVYIRRVNACGWAASSFVCVRVFVEKAKKQSS